MSLSNGVTIDVRVNQTPTGHHVRDRQDRSHAPIRAAMRQGCKFGCSLPHPVVASVPHVAVSDQVSGFCDGTDQVPSMLLSVSVRGTEHQNLMGEAWERAPLLELGVHIREPVQSSGARTSSWVALGDRSVVYQPSIGFSCAPSGTTPVSRYRHSAINSLRASATIPIRRSRFPLLPKRRWYHWARALWG